MQSNLLKNLKDVPENKRNKFIKDNITLTDLKDIYEKQCKKYGRVICADVLYSLVEPTDPAGLTVESIFLIYRNIINEFKSLDISDKNSKLELLQDYFYKSLIVAAFETSSMIISEALKRGTIDLELTEIYHFYQDMFDIMDKKAWGVTLNNAGASGFIAAYELFDNVMLSLDNSNYSDTEKEHIITMSNGMREMKEKIVELEFNYYLMNRVLYHTVSEIPNNLSILDKMGYLIEINLPRFFKDFLNEEVENFIDKIGYKAFDYSSLYKVSQKEHYINFILDKDNQKEKLFTKKLLICLLKNSQINNMHFSTNDKINLVFNVSNPENKEQELEVFKDFVHSLFEFIIKKERITQINDNDIDVKNLISRFENKLREVELFTKLDSIKKNSTQNNKKNKI